MEDFWSNLDRGFSIDLAELQLIGCLDYSTDNGLSLIHYAIILQA